MASQLAPQNISPQGAAVPFSTVCTVSGSKARSSQAEKKAFFTQRQYIISARRHNLLPSVKKESIFRNKITPCVIWPVYRMCRSKVTLGCSLMNTPGSLTLNQAVTVTLIPFYFLNFIMFCSCGATREHLRNPLTPPNHQILQLGQVTHR